MIETYIVKIMVVVEVWDIVPNNESLKIKWKSKASEVEDEAIGEDSHLDVETTRTSIATTVKNLDTMPQIAGTELKILPIASKQQLMWIITLLFFLLLMIQVFRMMFGTLTPVLATTCAGRKNFSWNSQKEFMKVWAREILQNSPLKANGRSKSFKKMVSPSIFSIFIICLTWIVIFSVSVNYSKKDINYKWKTMTFDRKLQKEAS